MRLQDLRATHHRGEYRITASVETARDGVSELWFSVPEQYEELVADDRLDGFVVGLVYSAMHAGEDLHVAGKCSEQLVFNLNNYAIPLLKAFSPSAHVVQVHCDTVTADRYPARAVGSGFSGGVDSFSTIYDRHVRETSSAHRIDSLLFMNVGAHGGTGVRDARLDAVRRKFRTLHAHLRRFPAELGLDLIPLDSNLHSFHPWGHQRTHTLTSAAGVLVLQKHFAKYYYASSGVTYETMLAQAPRYREIDVGEYCEPILLPLLSTETLAFVSDGCRYTRSEKLARLVEYEPFRRFLNVCAADDGTPHNCSTCPKCKRTMLTLSLMGARDRFDALFDFDRLSGYRRLEYLCSQSLVRERDPFARDNVDLARRMNVWVPGPLLSLVVCAPSFARTAAGRLLRRVGARS